MSKYEIPSGEAAEEAGEEEHLYVVPATNLQSQSQASSPPPRLFIVFAVSFVAVFASVCMVVKVSWRAEASGIIETLAAGRMAITASSRARALMGQAASADGRYISAHPGAT